MARQPLAASGSPVTLARLAEMGKSIEGVDMNRVIVVRDKKSGRVKLVNVPKLDQA